MVLPFFKDIIAIEAKGFVSWYSLVLLFKVFCWIFSCDMQQEKQLNILPSSFLLCQVHHFIYQYTIQAPEYTFSIKLRTKFFSQHSYPESLSKLMKNFSPGKTSPFWSLKKLKRIRWWSFSFFLPSKPVVLKYIWLGQFSKYSLWSC